MDKKLLIDLFGSEAKIAEHIGHTKQLVNAWGKVPEKHHKVLKQKLRARIKFLEKRIQEANKQIYKRELKRVEK